jgi:uncharacterized protein (DUF433 family)
MAETQTPTAEARLEALEARLAHLESRLMQTPVPTGCYRLLEGPPGVTILCLGGSPVDLASVQKALESVAQREPHAEQETPVAPWEHLVARRHPWRKQFFIKGRNMTVRQLVGGVRANQFTEEQAAANYDLPVEAIREALAYAAENAELLDLEAAYERYLLAQGGNRRGPQAVP